MDTAGNIYIAGNVTDSAGTGTPDVIPSVQVLDSSGRRVASHPEYPADRNSDMTVMNGKLYITTMDRVFVLDLR